MWKYFETDAYNTIGLHDCKSDFIRIDEHDLIICFPDGFKLCPGNKHNKYNYPVMTGQAQLCFHGLYDEMEFDRIYLYKKYGYFEKLSFAEENRSKKRLFLNSLKKENTNWSS